MPFASYDVLLPADRGVVFLSTNAPMEQISPRTLRAYQVFVCGFLLVISHLSFRCPTLRRPVFGWISVR